MDTTDWTVDDHIAWIRARADQARVAAKMVQGWQLDNLGTHAGTVEVIFAFGEAYRAGKPIRVTKNGKYVKTIQRGRK